MVSQSPIDSLCCKRRSHSPHHSFAECKVDRDIGLVAIRVHFALTLSHDFLDSFSFLVIRNIVNYGWDSKNSEVDQTHFRVLFDKAFFVCKVDISLVLFPWIYPAVSDGHSHQGY